MDETGREQERETSGVEERDRGEVRDRHGRGRENVQPSHIYNFFFYIYEHIKYENYDFM